MSTVQYKGSRGGPASAATHSNNQFDPICWTRQALVTLTSHSANTIPSTSSPQLQQPPPYQPQTSSSQVAGLSLSPPTSPPSSPGISYNRARGKLDISPEHNHTREELLREAVFSDWRDDATNADLAHPDEMQKRDPLATKVWKLYSKTKTQLPNHERMENLTWRMMAMNLKRKEREQARYVLDGDPCWVLDHNGSGVLS